jgi:hypothetical protein
MIRHQMPLFDPALLLLGQLPKYLSEVPPQLNAQRLPATFRNGNNVVFALALRVA